MISCCFVSKTRTVLLLLILTTLPACSTHEGAKIVVVTDATLWGGRVDPPIEARALHAKIRSENQLTIRGKVETWTAANRSIALSSSSSDSNMEFVSIARSGVTQIIVSGSLDCRNGCILDTGVENKYSLLKKDDIKLEPGEIAVICVSAYTNKSIGSRESMISSVAASICNGTSGDSLPAELDDITFVIYSVSIE